MLWWCQRPNRNVTPHQHIELINSHRLHNYGYLFALLPSRIATWQELCGFCGMWQVNNARKTHVFPTNYNVHCTSTVQCLSTFSMRRTNCLSRYIAAGQSDKKIFFFLIKQQFVGVGCVAIKKVRLTPPIIGFVRKSVKHRAQRNHPPETCLFANNAEMPLHETANRVLRRKVYCCVVAWFLFAFFVCKWLMLGQTWWTL